MKRPGSELYTAVVVSALGHFMSGGCHVYNMSGCCITCPAFCILSCITGPWRRGYTRNHGIAEGPRVRLSVRTRAYPEARVDACVFGGNIC